MKSILFFLIAAVSASLVPDYVQRRDNASRDFVYSQFPEFEGHKSMMRTFGIGRGVFWAFVVDTDTSYISVGGSLFESTWGQELVVRSIDTIPHDNSALTWGFNELICDLPPDVTVVPRGWNETDNYFYLYDEKGENIVVIDYKNYPKNWKSLSRFWKLSNILARIELSALRDESRELSSQYNQSPEQ